MDALKTRSTYFSRKSKMIISEWARAIRVAHSVKKTFILGIPGKEKLEK